MRARSGRDAGALLRIAAGGFLRLPPGGKLGVSRCYCLTRVSCFGASLEVFCTTSAMCDAS